MTVHAEPTRPPAPKLVDERSSPSVRRLLGGLLAHAAEADFAIARIRLAGLDLSRKELGGVRRCRVLVGRVDAGTFAAAEAAVARDPEQRASLLGLREFVVGGRAEVRSAGTDLWAPDFSVLHGPGSGGTGRRSVVFIGCHYFGRPDPSGGPALTCVLTAPEAAALAVERFEELWEKAYDIGPVVADMIDGLLAGGERS